METRIVTNGKWFKPQYKVFNLFWWDIPYTGSLTTSGEAEQYAENFRDKHECNRGKWVADQRRYQCLP
ncbi:MAG: hypothetical protein WC332_00295 [Clostridia bacterium]|jgi:hypothetical protein